MPRRRLDDWLTAYHQYTEETEPPLSYHTWTGISVIAGALQRKVYMYWGHSTIYPNQYIVLVGPSGRARKGEAINIGKALFAHIGVPITSERITREALVRYMQSAQTTFTDQTTGKLMFHCSITTISEELSVFLGQKEIGFLADLTNWYDSRDEWTYETKGAGTDKVVGMCFNFLGGTAPDWLPSILPQEAVGGGWTSRTMFIVEEDKRKIVSNPNLLEEDEKLKEDLLYDLEQINSISGEMTFSEDALETYIEWYEFEEHKAAEGNPAIADPRFEGYNARRATHIKKIAMCLTLSRANTRVISKGDFDRSLLIMEKAERKMTRAFRGLGQSRYAAATEAILSMVQKHGEIKRSIILRRFYRDIDSFMMENIEKLLEQMKVITVVRQPETGDVLYRAKDHDEDAL